MHLKLARVSADLTDSGRLFHTVRPETEKAQSPNLVLVCGTMKYVNFTHGGSHGFIYYADHLRSTSKDIVLLQAGVTVNKVARSKIIYMDVVFCLQISLT